MKNGIRIRRSVNVARKLGFSYPFAIYKQELEIEMCSKEAVSRESVSTPYEIEKEKWTRKCTKMIDIYNVF